MTTFWILIQQHLYSLICQHKTIKLTERNTFCRTEDIDEGIICTEVADFCGQVTILLHGIDELCFLLNVIPTLPLTITEDILTK